MAFSNLWEISFGLASFGTGILSLFLSIAVIVGNPRAAQNRAWSVVSLCVAVWGVGLGFAILSPDAATSSRWNQVFYSGGVWIPSATLWFVSVYTGRKAPRALLAACILTSAFLTAVAWFRLEWFVSELIQKGPFRFWDVLGPAYHVFTVLYFVGMIASFVLLRQAFGSASPGQRRKLASIAVGMGVGLLGGATIFIYNYGVPLFPYGQFVVFLYPAIISYAVLRHQAIDLGLLLRKTGLFVAVYALLIAIVLPIPIYIHREIHATLGLWSYVVFAEILFVGVVLSLGPFIYAFIISRSQLFRETTLAGLTHELKSPLATIESALEVLGDELKSARAEPGQAAYLAMIERNASRLRLYVDDLLVAFKSGDKRALLDRASRDIVPVVRAACAAAGQAGAKVSLDAPGSLVLEFDAPRVGQVLSNLLSNAAKFAPGGAIRVSVVERKVDVRVDVVDDGAGIDSGELPHVFDRFFQGAAGRAAKGTGLGLYIAKSWIEAHGGTIHADSDGPGRGSRFWFTIPKQPAGS